MSAGGRTWPRRLLGVVLVFLTVPTMATLGGGMGFFGALRWLGDPPADTAPSPEAPFRVTSDELDALLDATPNPTGPAAAASAEAPAPISEAKEQAVPVAEEPAPEPEVVDPFEEIQQLVREHEPFDTASLVRMSCEDLQWTRAWLWASRGYAFTSPDARAWFAGKADYQRDVSLGVDEVEASWAPQDRRNVAALDRALRAAGCPCPSDDHSGPCPP